MLTPGPRLLAALFSLAAICPASAWDDSPSADPSRAREAPHTVLANPTLEAVIMHPDPESGFYRKRRFEWAGIVSWVRVGDHTFVGRPAPDGGEIHSLGLIGEFIPALPVGPSTEQAEDVIIRIGLGKFRNPADERGRRRQPEWIERATWTTEAKDHGIAYRQQFHDADSGIAYSLAKTISIDPQRPILTIAYRLTNEGTREIKTEHYNHNWFSLDGQAASPSVSVSWRFPPEPEVLEFKPRHGAVLEGNKLSFAGPFDGPAATWLALGPMKQPHLNFFRLACAERAMAVDIAGDWSPFQHKLYATIREICPESFVAIHLQPGDSQQWTASYTFHVNGIPPDQPPSS